jgi:Domain of unknown function (DUF1330)
MPAYVIAETDVTDPERYEQYKAASSTAIAAGGGLPGAVASWLVPHWVPVNAVAAAGQRGAPAARQQKDERG